jgi:DNA processing protein
VSSGACESCLRRTWLLSRLAGHLDVERKRIWELLGLSDDDLINAVAGRSEQAVRAEFAAFGADAAAAARERALGRAVDLVCSCDARYPGRLLDLAAPPAVLHVVGGLERLLQFCGQDPVALVGARKAGAYGTGVAWALAQDLGRSGVAVVSGMATGIDTAAHCGALEVGAATVAILPGPADREYPPASAFVHRRIVRDGVAVSEVALDTPVRSWMFAARNRLIAALSCATVVVQATARSGSLLTARASGELRRPIGAVPGQVTSQLSAGPNQLLADGAAMIRDGQDVLDLLYGIGARSIVVDRRPEPTNRQALLLRAIANGLDSPGALAGANLADSEWLAELAGLELTGRVRRGPGGRLSVVP